MCIRDSIRTYHVDLIIGRFFTGYTICAEPLNNDIPQTEKQDILSKRSKILRVVKDYIDDNLNPHTSNCNPNQTIQ